MIRWKFTFDKDDEQDWINEYCQQGWAMAGFFVGVVTFVPCQPGEYIYQIDLLPGAGLRADDYEGYVEFMHDTGVEVIQRWGRWVYLRKRAEEGPFEIYTDLDSQIAMYRRIRALFTWLLVIELCASVSGWTNLLSFPGSLWARCLVGFYIVFIAVVLRAVGRCSWKIKELERQRG